ncbi:MAG TPA: oligoendopeptidase F [Candidatus Hydrogenedentes bacterium]|nr:oligoendopeptidase F [Candidatus Hydrogenedentota bacterium]HPG70065.1 oligoendopeptidase F [Candidatus Hydrogenedentota bacterium]
MAKTRRIPQRSEVKVADTWDLSPLFKSDAAWQRAYRTLEAEIPKLEAFRGTLGTSAKALHACCAFQVEFEKRAERLGSYAFLKAMEDLSNSTYQGMMALFERVATRAAEATSFFAPEIRSIPRKTMTAFLAEPVLEPFRFTIEKLLRYRAHILSSKEERLLAMQGEVAGTADRAFEQLNDADLKFGFVPNEEGDRVELTQSSFRVLLESPRRSVRKQAFRQFYAAYEAHANTLASTLSSSVLQDIYQARARNYPSAIEAALFGDKVPVAVYDNLIAAVRNNLDTVYGYLELRRRALRIKEIHFYDTYVPMVEMAKKRRTFEQAAAMVCEALEPLGPTYCRALEKGLLGRWVDRYENVGKRSGAFSAGGYTGPPYILMNYKEDVVDSVFTLAHEAGHSMHTYYSASSQPFQTYHYTIFVAEVASTFNEQLLNRHLLERASSKKERAYLINREIDEIRGTLVRQTMFAEFEKVIHALVEAGEPLTRDRIRAEYRALLEAYFGPGFTVDDGLELEGLRIPHFYSAFYVYKYATGLAAAIALSEQVMKGGASARNRYLTFLKSGGSDYPLELLRTAGVDMESPEPVATAMARFKTLVEELETLV